MAAYFTRKQLLDALLKEVTCAQASFQAAQLEAWRSVAPDAAAPAAGYLGALNEIELTVRLKPYRKSWLQRLKSFLLGAKDAPGQHYEFTSATDPAAINLLVRIANGKGGYAASSEPDIGAA